MKSSLVFLFIVVGSACMTSCVKAEESDSTACSRPQFGKAEMGFAGCKPEIALKQLKELAETNDGQAMYMLGRIYELGGVDFGLPEIRQDAEAAKNYYLKAAEGGNSEAQSAIALIYWRQYRDAHENDAIYWWCKAALQGDYEASVNIGNVIRSKKSDQTIDQFCGPIIKTPPAK